MSVLIVLVLVDWAFWSLHVTIATTDRWRSRYIHPHGRFVDSIAVMNVLFCMLMNLCKIWSSVEVDRR